MGLDVYVGSVTRYLCGDWETVVQKAARESGMRVEIVRPHDPADAIRDPARILPVVLSWRNGLSAGLQQAGGPALDWDERPDAPYFTDKPAWDAYGDLVLWAAYAEHPGLSRPSRSVEEWHTDPAYSRANNGQTRYPTLLRGVEVWLPVDFPFAFDAAWVTGDERVFGSSQQLLRELDDLNAGSWRATRDELADWSREGKAREESLEKGARFALSVFRALGERTVENRLIMLLDY